MKSNQRLVYLPLGGAGEIGMNMYLYGFGPPGSEEFILIDIGVTFPDMLSSPGVDLIMPNPSFIEERKNNLLGIFITHAHEDHIGALAHLTKKFNVPIFCRDFSATVALAKLHKMSLEGGDVRICSNYPEKITLGPFSVSFVPISHSIPEASCLVIDNPIGRIIHTGDFKIDKTPVLGDPFDTELLLELSKSDVLALVCDSTNVFSKTPGRSEASLSQDITKLMKSQKGIVVATTFASNVARLLTLAECAVSAGRSTLVLGRAMHSMLSMAASTNLLSNFPSTVTIEEALNIPRENLFILATGSQGESRAASAQLAHDQYLDVVLQKGDCFLFSSKTIPGNEVAVSRIINNFAEREITVIDDQSGKYHVSGHANRPDLITLHHIFNPKVIIPMHGELRHLAEHKKLAESEGFSSIIVKNGDVIQISADGNTKLIERVASGRIYYDGGKLFDASNGTIKTRLQMAARGHISVSLLFENDLLLKNGIWVKSKGLPESADNELQIELLLEDSLEMELLSVGEHDSRDDDKLEGIVKRVCNKVCQKNIGRKPIITTFINRIS